jgi:hypothetical protein
MIRAESTYAACSEHGEKHAHGAVAVTIGVTTTAYARDEDDKEIENREDFSSALILNNFAVPDLCEVEILDQALCEIVDRELVGDDKLSSGTVWCDDVAEHHLRITALGGDKLHPRRFAVYCMSCETAVHDESLQLRDSVCQHLRDSSGRQGHATLSRLARWTHFVQGVLTEYFWDEPE